MSIENLKLNYDKVASEYEKKLCHLWEISDGYWVGEEKGGLYCFLDTESINYGDMVFAVNNSIPFKDFLEWSDYNSDASEFGFDFINFRSWVAGCPRLSQSAIDRLKKLKKDLEEAINEERNNYDQRIKRK